MRTGVRSASIGTALAAIVAVTAACGSGGNSAGGSAASGSASGSAAAAKSGEVAALNVGYVPYTGDAPLYLGMKRGTFTEHGLKLTMQPAQAPAAVIARLVNGQQQIGFTTTITLMTTVENGTDVKCLGPVDGQADPKVEYTGLFVQNGSGVQKLTDLEGKKVGVTALGSLNHLFVMEMVAKAGGDAKKVQFVQLPFPQMQATLEQGRIDAVVATAPFSQQIVAAGKSRSLAWQEKEFIPNGQGTCWAASGKFIKEHPDQVKAFIDANKASLDYARAHVDEALATLPSFLEITPEVAAKSQTGATYGSTLNNDSIRSIADVMVKHGFLKKAPSLDTIVYTPR